MFSTGILSLTNWVANVIMPTLAGLFLAGAIYRFSKAQHYSQLICSTDGTEHSRVFAVLQLAFTRPAAFPSRATTNRTPISQNTWGSRALDVPARHGSGCAADRHMTPSIAHGLQIASSSAK